MLVSLIPGNGHLPTTDTFRIDCFKVCCCRLLRLSEDLYCDVYGACKKVNCVVLGS